MMRAFCVSERLADARTSKNSVIRVLTLLTFWPPGPLLREALKTSSFSAIMTVSTSFSIISYVHVPIRLYRRYAMIRMIKQLVRNRSLSQYFFRFCEVRYVETSGSTRLVIGFNSGRPPDLGRLDSDSVEGLGQAQKSRQGGCSPSYLWTLDRPPRFRMSLAQKGSSSSRPNADSLFKKT